MGLYSGKYSSSPGTQAGYVRRAKVYFANTKRKFLAMYGESCACCGETDERFLTIDHIQGQAGVQKKKTGAAAYREALAEHRPDLFQTLCYNCNMGRRFTGVCPHELSRSTD